MDNDDLVKAQNLKTLKNISTMKKRESVYTEKFEKEIRKS